MSDYNFVLKKTAFSEWTIYTDKGVHMHTLFNCLCKSEAVDRSTAWASSWPSVSIKVEDEKIS
jgi:hypothetical protein